MAVSDFGKGRCVYISGLPYSFENSRILYRSIIWAAHEEEHLHRWFSTNYNVEVHAYVKNGKYCVVNNTYEPQSTTIYRGDGSSSVWILRRTRFAGMRSEKSDEEQEERGLRRSAEKICGTGRIPALYVRYEKQQFLILVVGLPVFDRGDSVGFSENLCKV